MFLKVFWMAARKVRLKDILEGAALAKELFDHIKEFIGHLGPETRKAVEALQQASTELSQRVEELAVATQTLAARATLALVLVTISLVLSAAAWIFLLFHRL